VAGISKRQKRETGINNAFTKRPNHAINYIKSAVSTKELRQHSFVMRQKSISSLQMNIFRKIFSSEHNQLAM
jgi:hypothetical protein